MRRHEINSASRGRNGHAVAVASDRLPELTPDALQCLGLSLRKQWKCYRKELRRCQRKFSERSVHDLRVSARRLISLLDLLSHFVSATRRKKTQNALKKHLDTFDDLRDTQVQLSTVRKLREKFPAARSFQRFLKKREQRLTRATRKRAGRLRGKPLGKLIEAARADVKKWQETAGSRLAGPLLLSAVNRAFAATKKLRDRIDARDTHSIHCTRVAFKKFRYVLEALADHLPVANRRLLARMHDYQTLMGDIQDAEVLLRAFQKFLRKEERRIQQAVLFEHELQRRRRQLIKKYLAAADRLQKFWPLPGSRSRAGLRSSSGNDRQERAGGRGSVLPASASKKKNI